MPGDRVAVMHAEGALGWRASSAGRCASGLSRASEVGMYDTKITLTISIHGTFTLPKEVTERMMKNAVELARIKHFKGASLYALKQRAH
jgi:hypothetical protein